jgi:hypothetical protein
LHAATISNITFVADQHTISEGIPTTALQQVAWRIQLHEGGLALATRKPAGKANNRK